MASPIQTMYTECGQYDFSIKIGVFFPMVDGRLMRGRQNRQMPVRTSQVDSGIQCSNKRMGGR